MKAKQLAALRSLPMILGALFIALVVAFVFYLKSLLDAEETPKKSIQVVTILPPPPPPPPPEELEPPPPPEDEVEIPEPEDVPEDVPDLAEDFEPQELGLDADGSAGSDGFGLAARKGGRGLLGGGSPFGWYAGAIQNDLSSFFNDFDELRKKKWQIKVKLWVDDQGAIKSYELVSLTGDQSLDSQIQLALSRFDRASMNPPMEMPQPIIMRINSKL